MPLAPVAAEKVLAYKMGKIIIHHLTNDELIEKRKQEFFALSYEERIKKFFQLMRVSRMFSQDKKINSRNKIIIKS
jgi:phosphopantetheine adenylyltransferase